MLAVGALFVGACGNDKTPSAGGSNTPAGATVSVELKEWSVSPAPASAAAGKVTFNVKNSGVMHAHEFVVVKTDLDAGALPVKADGSVNEDGAGFTAVGELEDIEIAKSKSTTFDLAAGKYVLFCNVVEETAMPDMGGIKSHYKLGMRIGFTVS
jgi:uncharacterized cupredoxin-like copper-binding protein